MKVSFVLVFTLFQVLVFSQVGTNITGNDSVPLDSFQLAIQEVSEIISRLVKKSNQAAAQ